jgi:hypothetical protein
VKIGWSEKLDWTGLVTGRPAGPVPVCRSSSKSELDTHCSNLRGAEEEPVSSPIFLEFQRIRNNRDKFDRIIGLYFWKHTRSDLQKLHLINRLRLLFLKILIFCEMIWTSARTGWEMRGRPGPVDKLTNWSHMLNRQKNFEFFWKCEIVSENM